MTRDQANALAEWKSIVGLMRRLVAGAKGKDLDRRFGEEGMSIRELVHHVAEANAVAASFVIAALGNPGCAYDWSWMLPFGEWPRRMGYAKKPIGPSLRLIVALNAYVVALVEPLRDGLSRTVRLRHEPGGRLHTTTVAQALQQEAEHARHHVEEYRAGRR
jgi:hypothetical protein